MSNWAVGEEGEEKSGTGQCAREKRNTTINHGETEKGSTRGKVDETGEIPVWTQ